ncbi:hypothetical protein [Streptomyces sp. NPDC007088]|uniref:hypothetical protein n=1 Tax=Streptomyces sp. NPDC007088 TaxID=3364773 RepID=UPI0036C8678B
MRIRATVAAVTVSGALALGALAVPAAQADDSASGHTAGARIHQEAVQRIADAQKKAAAHSAPKAMSRAATVSDEPDPSLPLDVSFSKVSVNKGKPVVVGSTKDVHPAVTFTLNHNAKVDVFAKDFFLDLSLWRGPSWENSTNDLFLATDVTCKKSTSTAATCSAKLDTSPYALFNSDAGANWKVEGFAIAFNGQDTSGNKTDWSKVGIYDNENVATTKATLQRAVRLTTNAAPEPVKKGATLTVTGALTRANWEAGNYGAFTGQSVRLQYLKKGAKTWSTLKTVKSDGKGKLKTTVKSTADGYYRYAFAGTAASQALSSTSDYVDVK